MPLNSKDTFKDFSNQKKDKISIVIRRKMSKEYIVITRKMSKEYTQKDMQMCHYKNQLSTRDYNDGNEG